MTPEALARLPYLQAFVQETFRAHLTTPTGMPRISPGAVVDGIYVPKGVSTYPTLFSLPKPTLPSF